MNIQSIPCFAVCLLGVAQADVVINEVHYDPEPTTEFVEFVEFHNTGSEAVDLSLWHLTAGISLSLPAGTSLEPNGFLLLAENPAVRCSQLARRHRDSRRDRNDQLPRWLPGRVYRLCFLG